MLTRDQLADLLNEVNVADLAEESRVSVKTIYRLRHKANPPNFRTVEKLVEAAKRLKTGQEQKATA